MGRKKSQRVLYKRVIWVRDKSVSVLKRKTHWGAEFSLGLLSVLTVGVSG